MTRKPGAWEWSRTAQTRKSMLQAAREVFTEHGFAEASVADVVERAGSSVGSLYHHFGGKTELFLALWEDHQAAHEEAAAGAVARARRRASSDPLELFIAGARAFLEGAWERRDLARLFMDGDGPPGFELMRRTRGREWVAAERHPARGRRRPPRPPHRRRPDDASSARRAVRSPPPTAGRTPRDHRGGDRAHPPPGPAP